MVVGGRGILVVLAHAAVVWALCFATIPFVLIFLSTWLTGHAVTARRTRHTERAGSHRQQPIGRAA